MTPPDPADPLRTADQAPPPAAPDATVPSAARTAALPPGGGADPTVTRASDRGRPAADGGQRPPDRGLPSVPGYEVLGVLGRGGMGVVYRARHLTLKRTVALKMVLAGGHAGPGELARFRTEAEAVARLQHPNIVQIHDVGEANGHPYCALEYVDGGTLAGRLDGQPLPPREAAGLVEVLARAVQAAHARNVVHRDLKPANVLLAADGTPKITDFGLARQLDADSRETQAGAVMGSPSYMAPEQASGRAHEAGPPADVYALGAILYECLAGRPPFRGDTVVQTLDLVRTADPVPPSRVRAKVPRDLETVCLKAMAKEPARRYPTAADLAADLRRFLDDESIVARPAGATEKLWRRVRRNPAMAGLTAAVVALGAVMVAVLARPRPEPAAPAAAAATPEPDTSTDDLLAVVAELDRTDPDWRLEQIEAKRPAIPDDRNGALQIGRFRKAVAVLTGRPMSEGGWHNSEELYGRLDALSRLPPTAPLPEADLGAFRAELERVAGPLAEARRMADFPAGRFTAARTRDVVSTLLPDQQAGTYLARLLLVDAAVGIHDGDRAQAMRDIRAIWNTARAYDEEPVVVVQLMRMAIVRFAVRAAERLLAWGVPAGPELEALRPLADGAAGAPVLATMLRGERGAMHYFFSSLGAGDLPHPGVLKAFGIDDRSQLPAGREVRRIHAWLLAHFTKAVDIARQPPERWPALVAAHDEAVASAPSAGTPLVEAFTRDTFAPPGEARVSIAGACAASATRHAAELRTAAAGLAVERFRLARGGWPRDLAEVVPAYLEAVPTDPYDGQPLRYRRTADGVVVYCLGPDRADNGGTLDRAAPSADGTDIGFQLRDPGERPPAVP